MADATISKRLHVGGLTPAITTSHIKDRFSSFGTVSDVEELGVDGLGQPRPFTFLTLQTTPNQLKKCLNILSGSFWRGTQLRLSEAKPNYTTKYTIPSLTSEEKRKILLKKRKRVESSRGEDVGKLSQDIRVVNEKIAKKKKFWLIDENNQDGDEGGEGGKRLIRPITIKPTHPIGKPIIQIQTQSDKQNGKKVKKIKENDSKRIRIRGPPERLRRRVINPISYGSIYISGNQLESNTQENVEREEGEWEFEEFEENEDLDVNEDGKSIIGIWRKKDLTGKIVEENIVRGQKRNLQIQDNEDDDYGNELELPKYGEISSPLFGNRILPTEQVGEGDRNRSESPLFPSRSTAEHSISQDGPEEGGSSPLFPTRNTGEQRERSSSPLFPTRNNEDATQEQPSLPLFPTQAEQSTESDQEEQQSPSPLFPTRSQANSTKSASASDEYVTNTVQQASSPLFPSRAAKSPSPIRLPSPPPAAAKKAVVKPKNNLPEQVLASARAERSSALGVLGSLIKDLSPPLKKEKVVWEVYPETDSEDEIEVGRGRSKSIQSENPTVVAENTKFDVVENKEPQLDIPIDEEPVDASSSSSSRSSSSSGSSGSSESNEDKMDVDPPKDGNGDGNAESTGSGSGSGSGSSSSGSGSGDDDSDDDNSSSESDSSDSESDDESEEEEEDKKGKDKSTSEPIIPKPSGLKEMFAPTPSSSLNFGSTSNTGGGFSLLANFGDDIELDEDMEIPTHEDFAEQQEGGNRVEELQPLPISLSSGRGKIKFDATSETPLFFDIPTTNEGGSSTRKGESRNLYNELVVGIPTTIIDENEEEVPGEPSKLIGFNRLQSGETDESMKKKWEMEKLELTQSYKKKHREAKKSKKRRGGEEVE